MLRTASGKKASPASVARLHEYHEWLDARASDRCDDSWKAFMAERRSSQEKARLRKLGVQRTATRYCAATGRAAPTDAAQLAHMGAALRAQRQQGEHERREQRKATGATENAAGPRYRIRRGLEQEFDDWWAGMQTILKFTSSSCRTALTRASVGKLHASRLSAPLPVLFLQGSEKYVRPTEHLL